jgi:hypothetical protein
MTVANEPRLRVNDQLPDTSDIRRDLAGHVIAAVRAHSSAWDGECERLGEDYVVAYLRDVVNSLPDADVLTLEYLRQVSGPQFLAYDFCGKLTDYNELRRQVMQIAAEAGH